MQGELRAAAEFGFGFDADDFVWVKRRIDVEVHVVSERLDDIDLDRDAHAVSGHGAEMEVLWSDAQDDVFADIPSQSLFQFASHGQFESASGGADFAGVDFGLVGALFHFLGVDELAFFEDQAIAFAFERAVEHVHGWHADEACDEAIDGMVVGFEWCVLLLDEAVLHDDDAIAERHGFFLVVRHVDRRGLEPLVQTLELGPRGDAELGVEVGERFVEEEAGRFADDRSTDGHTLTLSA